MTQPKQKLELKTEFQRYFFMIVASCSYALSIDVFLLPNSIVTGGVTGAATLISLLTGLGAGTFSILLNLPILLLGLRSQGKWFILRCLITTTVLGIFIDLFAGLPSMTTDPLMASIYGGIVQGVGIGLFCRYSVSSGGTELLARILLPRFPAMSLAGLLAALDGIVVLVGSIVLRNPENMLRALIVIYLSAKVSDLIITGLDYAKMVYIISDHADEVAQGLISNSPRGVTKFTGVGMYTHRDKNMLMTVVKRAQLAQLRQLVKQADSAAFVIVSETTEVLGNGWKNLNE
ncbi:MAG: YitT family protein [Anaerotruncus sp.]|nr:YitT family protein [Anaerotruncus sp.]